MIADNPAPQRRAPAFNRAALFTIGATVAVGYAAIAGVIIDNPGEVAPLEAARPALAIFLFAVTAVLALQAAGGFFRHVSTALPIIFFAVLKFSGFYGAGEYFRLSESGALAAAAIGLLLVSALSVHVASRRNAEALSGALFFSPPQFAAGFPRSRSPASHRAAVRPTMRRDPSSPPRRARKLRQPACRTSSTSCPTATARRRASGGNSASIIPRFSKSSNRADFTLRAMRGRTTPKPSYRSLPR